jgi:hypothetical protein
VVLDQKIYAGLFHRHPQAIGDLHRIVTEIMEKFQIGACPPFSVFEILNPLKCECSRRREV